MVGAIDRAVAIERRARPCGVPREEPRRHLPLRQEEGGEPRAELPSRDGIEPGSPLPPGQVRRGTEAAEVESSRSVSRTRSTSASPVVVATSTPWIGRMPAARQARWKRGAPYGLPTSVRASVVMPCAAAAATRSSGLLAPCK